MTDHTVRILLVEDNPRDVELTLHALLKANVTNPVDVARDGEEAMRYLFGDERAPARSPPDIVILDLKLPKVSGLEILERLKADPSLGRIPVVVLTASREERDLHRSYEHGANSFLVKPVDIGEFMRVVGALGMYWTAVNHPPPAATHVTPAAGR